MKEENKQLKKEIACKEGIQILEEIIDYQLGMKVNWESNLDQKLALTQFWFCIEIRVK